MVVLGSTRRQTSMPSSLSRSKRIVTRQSAALLPRQREGAPFLKPGEVYAFSSMTSATTERPSGARNIALGSTGIRRSARNSSGQPSRGSNFCEPRRLPFDCLALPFDCIPHELSRLDPVRLSLFRGTPMPRRIPNARDDTVTRGRCDASHGYARSSETYAWPAAFGRVRHG